MNETANRDALSSFICKFTKGKNDIAEESGDGGGRGLNIREQLTMAEPIKSMHSHDRNEPWVFGSDKKANTFKFEDRVALKVTPISRR